MKPAIIALMGWLMALPLAAHSQECQTTTLHDGYDSLQLSFSTSAPAVGTVTLDGQQFATLAIEGCGTATAVGLPALPVFASLIEAPLCKGFDVRVTDAVWDTVDAPNLAIAPVQTLRAKSDTRRYPLDINRTVYATDAFYAEPLAAVESVGIARDRNLARLQFSPVRYNPVSRKLAVCRQATVTVVYTQPDTEGTKALFARYYTPAFNSGAQPLNSLYAKDLIGNSPVRYLIVAHSMFRGRLDNFVQWKRRKGFLVDVAYTDSAAVGTTTTSIAAFIASQYTNASTANPAPAFLLLVGDVQQIPAFRGVNDTSHYTDLYYATWTSGDHVPDCHYGRFSAQNISQLTPQIDKTLMYEQYTFPDPSFLDRAVMVAGVDAGNAGDNAYHYGDPSMDYAITQYINGTQGYHQVRYFKNDTSIVPPATHVIMGSSSDANADFIRQCYSNGAGIINYTAHGSPTCWGTPYFGTNNVPSMTNHGKFGLMIGNCCQSNTFAQSACLGESLLRRSDYAGAVGYIGASNNTYWTWDFYWTVGYRSSVVPSNPPTYNSNRPGAYDRLCHTHNETFSNWATTQGSIVMAGNMAVTVNAGNSALYYWEIYHLMGDPSVMPYLKQALAIPLSVQPVISTGTVSLPVNALPHAYVALTDSATHSLVAATYANSQGVATLTLPSQLAAGTYEVVATAQNNRPSFRYLRVVNQVSNGAYAFATNIASDTPPQAGGTTQLTVSVKNIGSDIATHVVVHLMCNSPYVNMSSDSISLPPIDYDVRCDGTTPVSITFSPDIPDGTLVILSAVTTWGTNGQSTTVRFPFNVSAPVLTTEYSSSSFAVIPGGSATMTATISNLGHAPVSATRLDFCPATSLLAVGDLDTVAFDIAPGTIVSRQVLLQADSLLPQGIVVPLGLQITGTFRHMVSDTLTVVTAPHAAETFEGGSFHLQGWQQEHNAWIFVNNEADASLWSLRSAQNLNHNDSSVVSLTYTFSQSENISFRYKVSSEHNYDKFHFYIDNVHMMEASGEVGWTSVAYPVEAGTHTFRFCYRKDYSVSDSSDCAWIDNLTLPATTVSAVFRRDTVCMGSLYVIGGDTIDTQNPTTGVHSHTEADHVEVVEYAVLSAIHTDIYETACDSLYFNGQLFTESATQVFSEATGYGCDSVTTLHVTIHYSAADTLEVVTSESRYQWEGSLYTISGEYQHHYTTVEGCDSLVTLLLTLNYTGEGILDADAEEVKAYPSPTAGMVYLSTEAVEATVYDINGRQLTTQRQTRCLDLSALPAGVYTLRLVLPSGTATRRIVKR